MKTMMYKGMKRRAYADGGLVSRTTGALRGRQQQIDDAVNGTAAPASRAAPPPRPVVPAAAAPAKPKTIDLGVRAPTTATVNQPAQDLRTAQTRAAIERFKAAGDLQRARELEDTLNFAKGGKVPGKGNKDTVPAMLTPGEFVMRKAAVKAHGIGKMQQMNKAGLKRRSK